MRRLLCLVGLAACYAPAAQPGAPCDPATNQCPSGQSCTATGDGYFCLRGGGGSGEVVDAPGGGSDGDSAPPGDVGDFCYGTGLVRVCFPAPPSETITIEAATTINTAMVGGSNCSQIVAQPSGPSLCVISAKMFELKSGGVLEVTGANPLVLVATDEIKINGRLDAASHLGGRTGPGAQATCATGIDGEDNNQDRGGGGGAGGSFGTIGGDGGDGNGGQSIGGIATGITMPTVLVGGCPGGRGGNNGPVGGGPGGAGGGAVYLIGGNSISVSFGGSVLASGAAGGRGGPGLNASGAGGGGGAGGMIGLDAPNVSVTGIVIANGAGGGGGGGNDPAFPGATGAEPTSPTARAAGGNGGNNGGGDGGDGYARGQPAHNGSNGSNQYCGGGGGGGGGGIVRVFGVPPDSLGNTVSPAPI